MSTLNRTLAFRPRPELDAAIQERLEKEGWTIYAYLTRACEMLAWPDREPSPISLRAPTKPKVEKAPKKPRAAREVEPQPEAAAALGALLNTPSPKQSAFRQALANVSDGPVRPAPGSRLKQTKGRK